MRVIELTNKDKESYNMFVAENGGSFLQSFEWGEWQESNAKTAYRYIISDQIGAEPILSALVVKYSLPLGQHYLYTPYGPVVSKVANAHAAEEALENLIAHLKEKHAKALFIRVEPARWLGGAIPGKKSLNIQPGKTIILDIHTSEEQLLNNMHPKTRYNIKLSMKRGVIIKPITTEASQHEAAALLFNTLHRRKLVTPLPAYYQNMMSFFNGASALVTTYGAYYQDMLIATAITLDFGTTRTYVFGGSSTLHKNAMAPYLLHWTAIRDAQIKQLTTYDWYGAEGGVSDGAGIARFKLGFGGNTLEYPGAHDVLLRPLPYYFYTVARTLNRWAKHR